MGQTEALCGKSRDLRRTVAYCDDARDLHSGLRDDLRGPFRMLEAQWNRLVSPGIVQRMAAVRRHLNVIAGAHRRLREDPGLVPGLRGDDQKAFQPRPCAKWLGCPSLRLGAAAAISGNSGGGRRRRSRGSRLGFENPQSDTKFLVDLRLHIRIVLEELAGSLASLADPIALVAKP